MTGRRIGAALAAALLAPPAFAESEPGPALLGDVIDFYAERGTCVLDDDGIEALFDRLAEAGADLDAGWTRVEAEHLIDHEGSLYLDAGPDCGGRAADLIDKAETLRAQSIDAARAAIVAAFEADECTMSRFAAGEMVERIVDEFGEEAGREALRGLDADRHIVETGGMAHLVTGAACEAHGEAILADIPGVQVIRLFERGGCALTTGQIAAGFEASDHRMEAMTEALYALVRSNDVLPTDQYVTVARLVTGETCRPLDAPEARAADKDVAALHRTFTDALCRLPADAPAEPDALARLEAAGVVVRGTREGVDELQLVSGGICDPRHTGKVAAEHARIRTLFDLALAESGCEADPMAMTRALAVANVPAQLVLAEVAHRVARGEGEIVDGKLVAEGCAAE